MNGWEYKTRVFDFRGTGLVGKVADGSFDQVVFDHEANKLGWEGWELVSMMDTNSFDGGTRVVVASFKRPLTPERRAEIQAATKVPSPS